MCPQLTSRRLPAASRISGVERYAITPRSPEWFALRSPDLTMSEVGAVAGVDPWKTPYQVWAEKAGLASGPEENAAMRLGRWAEPAVACALAETHPELHVNYPLNLYVRDADNRLGGTPDADGFDDGEPVAFEFKVISRQSYEREWSDGALPLRYQVQTLGNAMLLDADHGVLAALVMGWQDVELVVHRIERNARAEAAIRTLAAQFWQAFDEGHAMVTPDYSRDGETLRQVFKPDPARPAPIDLAGDNRLSELLDHRTGLKASIKAAETECKGIDAEIVHKLNGSTAASLPGWKISNTMAHRDAYMVEAKDYPVLKVTKAKDAA